MPLDHLGERYAQNLFATRLDQLTREHSTRTSKARQDFAARGIDGGNAGFYHTQMLTLNLEHVEAVANAKADSLVEAYRRAGLRIDDAAVEIINQQASQWIDGQLKNVATNAKVEIGRSRLPGDMVRHIDDTIQHRLPGISSRLRMKLNRLRDEQLLDDRTAASARAAVETNRVALPVESRVETMPVKESSLASWWREWGTPAVIVAIIGVLVTVAVTLFPDEIRRYLGFEKTTQVESTPKGVEQHSGRDSVNGTQTFGNGAPVHPPSAPLPPKVGSPITVVRGTLSPPPVGKNVQVSVEGEKATVKPDDRGNFEMTLHKTSGERARFFVWIDGKKVYDDYQPLSGPVTLTLN